MVVALVVVLLVAVAFVVVCVVMLSMCCFIVGWKQFGRVGSLSLMCNRDNMINNISIINIVSDHRLHVYGD